MTLLVHSLSRPRLGIAPAVAAGKASERTKARVSEVLELLARRFPSWTGWSTTLQSFFLGGTPTAGQARPFSSFPRSSPQPNILSHAAQAAGSGTRPAIQYTLPVRGSQPRSPIEKSP